MLFLKILLQIQQTSVQAQRALNVTRQQTAVKERERRIVQLTIDEISQMQSDVNLYKGVGKMWVLFFYAGTNAEQSTFQVYDDATKGYGRRTE
jgi:hypothetical protein